MYSRLIIVGAILSLAVVFFPIATSQPHEWLLKIRKGQLAEAGIGITTWVSPFDKVVRFPSTIHKVSFSAQQVSKEMQGVEVSGFIVWAVNRENDGPLKAYRYLQGLTQSGTEAANGQIRGMAESIIRHQVANEHLTEVMRNRDLLREKVRNQMLEVVQGWGMWLETVEVTDVRVLSDKVFKDLQAEFRMQLHARAEEIRQNTTRDIKARQTAVNMDITRRENEAEAQLAYDQLWQKLKEAEDQAKADLEFQKISIKKLEQEKELDMLRVKNKAEAKAAEQAEELKLQQLKADAELEILKKKLEVESKMSPANLQKYTVDATKEVYKSLPLHEVKLLHSGSGHSLESLLPGLSHVLEQVKKE